VSCTVASGSTRKEAANGRKDFPFQLEVLSSNDGRHSLMRAQPYQGTPVENSVVRLEAPIQCHTPMFSWEQR
jgi:hypothetical protein